ncbi:MAG: HAD hydrolase family protein, partial [Ignavibacteria bacterium]|nr:HAD hydrolase family protein [Ignavibacteria bacterium]
KEYGERLDVIYSGLENIELMPKGISKGNALLELMELKGYKPTEVAVIGDSMNDLTMLQVTPYSFAMSHSDAIIKESSHYVVKSVADAIDMVLKINKESN